jgi:hypothetical protein
LFSLFGVRYDERTTAEFIARFQLGVLSTTPNCSTRENMNEEKIMHMLCAMAISEAFNDKVVHDNSPISLQGEIVDENGEIVNAVLYDNRRTDPSALRDNNLTNQDAEDLV